MSAPELSGGLARAADLSGFESTGQPWPLRDTESFEYHSKAVGDNMAIGVWSPPKGLPGGAAADEKPLDVVYVLDGSWALGVTATICMLQYVDLIHPGFAPVLLVGVDYPVGRPNARTRDYTMADQVPSAMKEKFSTTPETTPGGADKFLAFLEEELDPFIRSRYNTTGKRAGILGDSFGGTFTFYAFLKQSKLFDRYWLGSPGIFTNTIDYVAQFETLLKGKLAHPTKMFVTCGSREINGGVALYEEVGRNYNRLVSALNRVPNDQLAWASKIYDGHTHTSVVAPALSDALLYLFRP
ncbi:alpha/beta hydrolase [Steroidobacter flavus]|uniref:Alpha/beta hydrolase n=1 Tax=Steroidobacter flavus TaxID=1842136 RepID=A0ABV8T463_9GAMM